jgi:hypothetical protein
MRLNVVHGLQRRQATTALLSTKALLNYAELTGNMCGYRRINAALARDQAIISREIVERRATVDESGQYAFAVFL